jgi:hypothetical protein
MALALGFTRVVNYTPRMTVQVVASLMIVIYDRNMLMVQATVWSYVWIGLKAGNHHRPRWKLKIEVRVVSTDWMDAKGHVL